MEFTTSIINSTLLDNPKQIYQITISEYDRSNLNIQQGYYVINAYKLQDDEWQIADHLNGVDDQTFNSHELAYAFIHKYILEIGGVIILP